MEIESFGKSPKFEKDEPPKFKEQEVPQTEFKTTVNKEEEGPKMREAMLSEVQESSVFKSTMPEPMPEKKVEPVVPELIPESSEDFEGKYNKLYTEYVFVYLQIL